ncbi:MAG: YceI family protein [Porticoccaceae bacterium]
MRLNSLFRNTPIPLIAWLLLGGCALQQDFSNRQEAPVDFPLTIHTDQDSDSVYKVDSPASRILITVRRGGLMASLGHDHIVASHDLQGYILLDRNNPQNPICRADFFARLANLEVDNPQLRAEAGLTTTPTTKDIAGTTSNMLKSIEAKSFPFARLYSSDCLAALSGEQSEVLLTIHGVSRRQEIVIEIEEASDSQLILSGKFSILQSDFGIEPFSIMNGLIKVEDSLELEFKIAALKFNRE